MDTNKVELSMDELEMVNGGFIPVLPDDSDNNQLFEEPVETAQVEEVIEETPAQPAENNPQPVKKPKEKEKPTKEVRKVCRFSYLSNIKNNPKLLAEHNKIRKLRGLPPLGKDGKPVEAVRHNTRKAPTNQSMRAHANQSMSAQKFNRMNYLIAKKKLEKESSGGYI